MLRFTKIILTVLVCIGLAGCSYFRDDPGDTLIRSQAPTGPLNIDYSYPQMARELSNGSVQIFPLDAPSPSYGMQAGWPRKPDPMTGHTAGDPNVMVYPLAEDGNTSAPMGMFPSMSPPSNNNTGFASPFTRDAPMPVMAVPAPEPMPVMAVPAQMPVMSSPAPQSVYPAYNEVSPEKKAINDWLQKVKSKSNPAPSTPASAAPMSAPGNGANAATIYFKHGSAALSKDDRRIIGAVARSSRNSVIRVDGHASERTAARGPINKDIINLNQSLDRAANVSSELIRQGVPASSIDTRGYGDARPASAAGRGSEAASRRVELYTVPSNYPMY